jgi:hypothetical protein
MEVRADAFRVAVAIFSDKNDFAVVFDYDDYDFRLVLLASSCCPLRTVSSQLIALLHSFGIGRSSVRMGHPALPRPVWRRQELISVERDVVGVYGIAPISTIIWFRQRAGDPRP